MEVIATKPGYFGKLRQPDDNFEVPEGAKASWFVPVKPVAKGGNKKAEDESKSKGADDLV